MKKYLFGVATGLIIAIVICTVAPKPPVDLTRIAAQDTFWRVRWLRDTSETAPPQVVPIPLPGGHDTLYYPIDSLPLDTATTVDSCSVFINDTCSAVIFQLFMAARGRLEYYKIRPLYNRFKYTASPAQKPFMFFVYGAVGFNQVLHFESFELGAIAFYKRFGLSPRIEFYPGDTTPVKYKALAMLRIF